ncbi:hypothetical protein [Marinifilum sp. D714]|uniref:hypothetical protein n=1 Tax=Marinifilum sp. D714 TaxID=2937523 RepID=UPI0027D1B20A|nr:hypothetical protein [Marinifilum sp. D714]MDQ2179750.1 hypothetical protein [Marinifilum sp. D714]
MEEIYNCTELNTLELLDVQGGGFAYDVGFAWRELGIYIKGGGGIMGQIDVICDLVENYKPVN